MHVISALQCYTYFSCIMEQEKCIYAECIVAAVNVGTSFKK